MDLTSRDLRHNWHPCMQMKDLAEFPALQVVNAEGCYFETQTGQKILDAISSWWCKPLGHGHPRLKQALIKQAERFEHVIYANTTNNVIVELSEHLAELAQPLNKVFYASDGACAVEVALKMSLHTRKITGQKDRTQFVALKNGFHGETGLALALSDLGLYKQPYEAALMQYPFIQSIPYVSSTHDGLWKDCSLNWQRIEQQLAPLANQLTAVVVEPIVQGTGGMKIYSQDLLKRLRNWCTQNDVHLIADEIMTGLGRTGLPLACQHADITPDFLCLGKSLTGGWLPMSATLTSQAIYDTFYDDYKTGKAFLHSHTFGGNPLAAAVALEFTKILQEEHVCEQATQLQPLLMQAMKEVDSETNKLINIRGIGGIVAAEYKVEKDEKQPRYGYEVFKKAVEKGALLRPLGNTLYWFPPLNITQADIEQLRDITIEAIKAVEAETIAV